jgi:hypothetical protein
MDVDFVVLLPCEGGGGVSRRLVPPLQHVLPTEHQRQRSFAQQTPPPPPNIYTRDSDNRAQRLGPSPLPQGGI